MADGVQTIDTTGFDEAIASFKAAINLYKEARELIHVKTRDLSDYWLGEGGDKFRKVNEKIYKGLEDDEDSLQAIIDNLDSIRRTYLEADTELASAISQ